MEVGNCSRGDPLTGVWVFVDQQRQREHIGSQRHGRADTGDTQHLDADTHLPVRPGETHAGDTGGSRHIEADTGLSVGPLVTYSCAVSVMVRADQ